MRHHWMGLVALALAGCAPVSPVTVEPTAPPPAYRCSVDQALQSSAEGVVDGIRYGAVLSWSEGEREACLALTRADGDARTTLVSSPIPAGWSERYDEYSTPVLHPELLQLSDGWPWVVTDRLAQGEGGGGGDVATLWRASDDAWTEVLTVSLETYTDINTLTEKPCSSGEARLRLQDGVVEVHPCFDGQPEPVQRWRFVDGRAEPVP